MRQRRSVMPGWCSSADPWMAGSRSSSRRSGRCRSGSRQGGLGQIGGQAAMSSLVSTTESGSTTGKLVRGRPWRQRLAVPTERVARRGLIRPTRAPPAAAPGGRRSVLGHGWWRWGRVELPVQDPSPAATTSVSDRFRQPRGRGSAPCSEVQSRAPRSGLIPDYATLVRSATPLHDASTARGIEAASTLTLRRYAARARVDCLLAGTSFCRLFSEA